MAPATFFVFDPRFGRYANSAIEALKETSRQAVGFPRFTFATTLNPAIRSELDRACPPPAERFRRR